MCGIFAYIGDKHNATDIVRAGLKRLDYRGYDSWGVATLHNEKITIDKQVGKITEKIGNASVTALGPRLAIGHTRWATNGAVTQINAHPHASTDNSFVLCQNGIVENHEELKNQLQQKGYKFISDTDTEVIVRLIEEKMKQASRLRTAVREAFLELKGRNTIIVLSDNGQIIAARNGSPLVVGRNSETGELFLSSDTLSFAPFANEVIILDNGQLVHINENLSIFDIKTNEPLEPKYEKITLTDASSEKDGFDHYMLKEIFESPKVVTTLAEQDAKPYEELAQAIKKARTVYTMGSGTAGIAAAQIAFYLRSIAKIPAVSLIGADAKEYFDLFTDKDLIIAPSQSGETADVLEVLEVAQKKGVKIASLVNMQGSMMTRISDFKFMSEAGPEICVMSTKVFTSQIVWGYLLAKTVDGKGEEARDILFALARDIRNYLEKESTHEQIKAVVEYLLPKKDIFMLGKYQNLQIMREGMVKIIEGSYKHAHAIPAGDLKHYAITLMEKGVPVIVALSEDETKADVLNAAAQVRARGAEVIGISNKDEQFEHFIAVPDTGETSALMNVIPLQLLSYYLALKLGNDIDKPRNIAKSVTVK